MIVPLPSYLRVLLAGFFASVLLASCQSSKSPEKVQDALDLSSQDGGNKCGQIGPQGCCAGSTLVWCENGVLQEAKCAATPACGWNSFTGGYDCGTDGAADPTGTFPWACEESGVTPGTDAAGTDVSGTDVAGTDVSGGDLTDLVDAVDVPSVNLSDATDAASADLQDLNYLADTDSSSGDDNWVPDEVSEDDVPPDITDTFIDEDTICTPECFGKECGSDGCEGICGNCSANLICQANYCVPPGTCPPPAWSEDVLKIVQLDVQNSGMQGNGLDVDGNPATCAPMGNCSGGVDNQLGGLLGQLEQFVDMTAELQTFLAQNADSAYLAEMIGFNTNGTPFTMNMYRGSAILPKDQCDWQTEKCGYLVGKGEIMPDTCLPYMYFDNATVLNGKLQAGGLGYKVRFPNLYAHGYGCRRCCGWSHGDRDWDHPGGRRSPHWASRCHPRLGRSQERHYVHDRPYPRRRRTAGFQRHDQESRRYVRHPGHG